MRAGWLAYFGSPFDTENAQLGNAAAIDEPDYF